MSVSLHRRNPRVFEGTNDDEVTWLRNFLVKRSRNLPVTKTTEEQDDFKQACRYQFGCLYGKEDIKK